MKIRQFLSVAVLVGTIISASAIPLSYEIGSGSKVQAHDSGPGLLIETAISPTLVGRTFTLEDGQAVSFDFFKIWTDETTINWGEDTSPVSILATLNFAVPELDALITGVTLGGRLFLQGGIVLWDDPVLVTASDREFTVSLTDTVFDVGLFALGDSPATIKATVKQKSSSLIGISPSAPAAVPDSSSTALLLGIALVVLVLSRFQRVRA